MEKYLLRGAQEDLQPLVRNSFELVKWLIMGSVRNKWNEDHPFLSNAAQLKPLNRFFNISYEILKNQNAQWNAFVTPQLSILRLYSQIEPIVWFLNNEFQSL